MTKLDKEKIYCILIKIQLNKSLHKKRLNFWKETKKRHA